MRKIKFTQDCAPKDDSGILYETDQVEEMNDASAEHWVRRGKAVYVDDEDGNGQSELDDIIAAIQGFDEDDKDLWTNGGKPKTEAIAAALGRDVTAKQRDAALVKLAE